MSNLAAIGYLVLDLTGFALLLGMLAYGAYRGDPDPKDNIHPHFTR